jgi:hypothetical protein
MGQKTMTIYFFTIEKIIGTNSTFLQKSELEQILKSISELELDRTKPIGRFYNDGTDERCMIFRNDRDEIPDPNDESYFPGLFIKRRTSNYPYENDDKGGLFQISLSNNNNELAEVTFFIIDISLRVLLLVSNLYVGSITSFDSYINNRLKKYHLEIQKLSFFENKSFIKIDFPFIVNESPENDFNSMLNITTLELNIAGSLNLLENSLKSATDDSRTAIRHLARFAQTARSKSMKLVLSSHNLTDKLDKNEIAEIFKKLKNFFKISQNENRFIVKGKIDDELRFLDLLNANYFHKTSFAYDGRYVPLREVFKRLYPIMDRYRKIFMTQNKFSVLDI